MINHVRLKRDAKTAVGPFVNAALSLRQPAKRPLVILGNGRSGTSWIGKALGQAESVIYYREPCNPVTIGVEDDTVWSRYVPSGGSDEFFETQLNRAFAGFVGDGSRWGLNRVWPRINGSCRVVVKEVATFLSVQWLYERWQPDILVVIRHPCPSALSALNLGLAPLEVERLEAMKNDKALLRDHIGPFRAHLETAKSPLEVAAAIWAIKNYVAMRVQARYPTWRIVRYEDLCAEPLPLFKQLYDAFSLPWTNRVSRWIESSTGSQESGPHSTSRISHTQIDSWKRKMTGDDIDAVRRVIAPFELPFYSDLT